MELEMSGTVLDSFRSAITFIIQSPGIISNGGFFRKNFTRFLDGTITMFELVHAFDREYPSTIGERYFGLTRVSSRNQRGRERPLTRIQNFFIVFEATVVPYLIRTDQERLGKFFRLSRVIFSLMYMTNMTDYSSLIGWLFGMKIVRSRAQQSESKIQIFFTKSVWGFVYLIQLMQWYYSHEQVLNGRISETSRVGPPPGGMMTLGGLPADPSICPICRKERKNPTALVATGNVFCYSCIWKWVEDHGTCPITKRPLPVAVEKRDYVRRLAS